MVGPLLEAFLFVAGLAQVRIFERHAVGQQHPTVAVAIAAPADAFASAADTKRHVFDDLRANLPTLGNAIVGCAVGAHDVLTLAQREVDAWAAQSTFGQRGLELGSPHLEAQTKDTDLANETLELILLPDRAAVDHVSKAAVGIALVFAHGPALILGQGRNLSSVGIGLAEGLQQVGLIPEPAVDASLNLARVTDGEGVAFAGQDGQTQFATTGEVLHVHLVGATPSACVPSHKDSAA